jgi:hypothetical protein
VVVTFVSFRAPGVPTQHRVSFWIDVSFRRATKQKWWRCACGREVPGVSPDADVLVVTTCGPDAVRIAIDECGEVHRCEVRRYQIRRQ